MDARSRAGQRAIDELLQQQMRPGRDGFAQACGGRRIERACRIGPDGLLQPIALRRGKRDADELVGRPRTVLHRLATGTRLHAEASLAHRPATRKTAV